MKSFITHQILCLNVARCMPAYGVEKKLKCVLWTVTQSSHEIMILEKKMIGNYEKYITKPIKRMQTLLKHAAHTVPCAAARRGLT